MTGVSVPIKIICVDDEPNLTELIAKSISKLGYETLIAHNAKEALKLLEQNADRVALVISDFAMPEMDGFALRSQMLNEFKHIPFVLVSGYVSREKALAAIELKISAFIEKPFQEEKILEVVGAESKDRVAQIREDAEVLVGFVKESEGLTEEMETLILQLEENPQDIDAINRIFACAHTIKGTSGFFKPDTTHRFTHRYEDYLSKFKVNPNLITPQAISVLLKGLDTIKTLISNLSVGNRDNPPLDDLFKVFNEAPDTNQAKPEKKLEAQAPAAKKPVVKGGSDELRVSVSILNNFMENSGELTVLRNMINKVVRVIESEHPGDQNIVTLTELLGEMHKVNNQMQDQVMDLRKVPLKQVFKPLTRTLRDLCINLKKEIKLELIGEDLRIDHVLAETLSKCLIHMLRNSADHGIENAEVRKKRGKAPEGKIIISASEENDVVVVRIKDDGGGIDPARVKKKAIESGLLTAQAAGEMSDQEAQMLIFEPGFSTAEKVTDVSGRGVGTDMVKTTIMAIGGTVDIVSKVGIETEFIFKLPIPKSVLIISSLLIKIKGETFAIPQENINRVIHRPGINEATDLKRIGNRIFLQEDYGLVPVVNLKNILGDSENIECFEAQSITLAEVQSKFGRFCLLVDEVLDVEDTVVKTNGSWFKDIPIYTGVTFLGDGRVGIILSVEGIAKTLDMENMAVNTKKEKVVHAAESTDVPNSSDPVLLFDIGTSATYGIPQSHIFRLEEFSKNEIQFSGSQAVVIYRNQTMPLLSLRKILNNESQTSLDFSGSDRLAVPVIVIMNGNRFVGYTVDSIKDFAKGREISKDFCVIQDEIVTLIQMEKINNFSSPRLPEAMSA